MTTTLIAPGVSPAATELIDRAEQEASLAHWADYAGDRFVHAHIAALRAGAAVLAVRGRPALRGRPRTVWELLERVAPELSEWAAYFAAGAGKRSAIEAGRDDAVTCRDADDQLRSAELFLDQVVSVLGLPQRESSAVLAPLSVARSHIRFADGFSDIGRRAG